MEDTTFCNRMISNLRATGKYYNGHPKDLGPSWVIHFTSERDFVKLLHEGYPIVVAFTIRSIYTKHLDRVLDEAAIEFYPHVKFVRAVNQGRAANLNVTKYKVKVLPFNYDHSAYGFREFFKRNAILKPLMLLEAKSSVALQSVGSSNTARQYGVLN